MSLLVQAADYLGNYALSSVVYFKFSVTDATGVLTTLGGTPAVKVYKDNGTTESTAGVTLTVDFDSRTGLCQVAIDTSSDGTFYAGGHDFEAVITAGTVGIVSVAGTPVGHFSLLNRVDTLADGVSHGGPANSSTATLALQTVNVLNPSGEGIRVEGSTNGVHLLGSFTGGGGAVDAGLLCEGTFGIYAFGNTAGAICQGDMGLWLDGNEGNSDHPGNLNALRLSSSSSPDAIVNIQAALGDGIRIFNTPAGKHDINLAGSGNILGNLTGTVGALTATGLDNILIDGKTLRAALQIIAAVVAGKVSGAGTATETFLGLDGSTTRVVETVDASGNRTGASYP